ncbi:MAG: FAD-dependent oxidoreductase [Thermodesulfobacteriota bacterium]
MILRRRAVSHHGPMKRGLEAMAKTRHDLLIVGGGITGACVAWDASLRGLRVALVERGDFGAATSAATSKLIHGGLRYLRRMELGLVRESLHERRILEVIAPHLVYPIPFLIPTYKGRQGKAPLTLGMIVYELLAYDRAHVDDPTKRIPGHRGLSPAEVLELEPGLRREGLTGGVLYYDCQVFSPERLTLEFLLSAAQRGTHLANYAEALEFLLDGERLGGALVEDRISGRRYEIHASAVVNATGPWADLVLQGLPGRPHKAPHRLVRSKGIHLVTRPLTHGNAVVLITEEGRHIFLIPWRDRTLIGTTDTPYEGHPDDLGVSEGEIAVFLGEVNRAYPSAALTPDHVLAFYAGLRPLVDPEPGTETYRASRRYEIQDHKEEGLPGLFTAVGGKYTTSRGLARKLVDHIFQFLGDEPPTCKTDTTPLWGGNIGIYASFLQRAWDAEGGRVPRHVLENLVRNYGSRYGDILELARQEPGLGRTLHPELPEIGAQVVHAVRDEMAFHLTDVILRRTGIGTRGDPGEPCLRRVCDLMARELGGRKGRVEEEMERAKAVYRPNPD